MSSIAQREPKELGSLALEKSAYLIQKEPKWHKIAKFGHTDSNGRWLLRLTYQINDFSGSCF